MPIGKIDLQNSGTDYSVDLVMCIDATGSMTPFIQEVKDNALTFYQRFVAEMNAQTPPKYVKQLRIKIIAFRDYASDAQPMLESKFFVLDDEVDEFRAFVNSIEASGGGDGPENALEALALAMKSKWTTEGTGRRHVIMLYTDAPALELGARAGEPNYPTDLPKDLAELRSMWEGQYMEQRAKRLLVYAPDCEPWQNIEDWSNLFHTPCSGGAGVSEADINASIRLLVHSI